MAKKKKQKQKSDNPLRLSESTDYSDPRRLESMIKRIFSRSAENLRGVEKEKPGLTLAMDMDPQRCRRRARAAVAYAPKIRELVQDFCPDIPGLFSIEEDWAYINSLPTTSYDLQEEGMSFTVGAAIWMLDRIKESGRIMEAVRLLPGDESILDEVIIPDIYDPVHHEEVILAMTAVIQRRNEDCLVPGQKKVKRSKASDPVERILADSFTVQGQHQQQVPSRERFEKLLAMVPAASVEQAVKRYEEKLFSWTACYYRCRANYCEKQRALERRREQFVSGVERQAQELRGRMGKPPLPGIEDTLKQMTLFDGPAKQTRFDGMEDDPFQLLRYFETESQKLEEEVDALNLEITRFIHRSHRLGSMPYARIQRDYGTEIADLVSAFTFSDPYEICFALLYLLDRDSDLPWLYYPGIVLSENAGAMLPWYDAEYDESEDAHWDEYYGVEPRLVRPEVKNAPELADWYSLDYVYRNNDLDFQYRYNLAQIVYEITGAIPPRDLHRYDDGIRHLRRYGITGKKMQVPLLYCMSLLGEGRNRTSEWGLRAFHDLPDDLPDTVKEDVDPEVHASLEDLQTRAADLKRENDRLKQAAYEAERELRELRKKQEALLQKSQAERQELAQLRELVFLRENAGEEEDRESVTFPYTVRHSTVVFGGHETWAKAIRPMLAGDIRFVDRGMRPDTDLIRHADMVWLQPNSLSHSDYYKIIRIIRTQGIPLHYFQFASAEKCALQLVREDQKQGSP